MNHRVIGRIVAILMCGVMFALSVRAYQHRCADLGKELYLAKQAARFDKHYAQPDSLAFQLVVGVSMMVLWFGAYELIAYGVTRILDLTNDAGKSP